MHGANWAAGLFLALVSAGCADILGLSEFEDAPVGGSGGAPLGGSGPIGGGGAGGDGAMGGRGGAGAGGGGGASVTYECQPSTGAFLIGGFPIAFPRGRLFSIGNPAAGTAYTVIAADLQGDPQIAVGTVDGGGAVDWFGYEAPGFAGTSREVEIGALHLKPLSLTVYGYAKSDNGFQGPMTVAFPFSGAGIPVAGAATVNDLAVTGCAHDTSVGILFAGIAFGFEASSSFMAMGCDYPFGQRVMFVGDPTSDIADPQVVSAPMASDTEPVALVRAGGVSVVQTAANATFRYGNTAGELQALNQLNLNQAVGDETIALGIAPTLDGAGVVAIAARFDTNGNGTLRSGSLDAADLAELGGNDPPFLRYGAALVQDKVAFQIATSSAGLAAAAPSNDGSGVVLHWFARDGQPRVVSALVASGGPGEVSEVSAAFMDDDLSGATQRVLVSWVQSAVGTNLFGRIMECSESSTGTN